MDKAQKNGYDVTTDELMVFLKDNMLTKEEAKVFATKEDLGKLRLDIADHIDEKLVDLKGDLVILTMEPFPKLMV